MKINLKLPISNKFYKISAGEETRVRANLILLVFLFTKSLYGAVQFRCTSLDQNYPYNVESIMAEVDRQFISLKFKGFEFWEKYIAEKEVENGYEIKLLKSSNTYFEDSMESLIASESLFTGGALLRDGRRVANLSYHNISQKLANYLCVKL